MLGCSDLLCFPRHACPSVARFHDAATSSERDFCFSQASRAARLYKTLREVARMKGGPLPCLLHLLKLYGQTRSKVATSFEVRRSGEFIFFTKARDATAW